jgi:aspartate dehydrogenase
MKINTIGILGCGNIAGLLSDRGIPQAVAAVYDSIPERAENIGARLGARPCATFEEFIGQDFDAVVETASIDAVQSFGPAILEAGRNLVVLSGGAFADAGFRTRMMELAGNVGRRIHIPSGAIFGLDNLKIGQVGGIDRITQRTTKPPTAFRVEVTEATCLFRGNATECIASYPKNVNVAAAIALAADRDVTLELWADPAASANRHEILVEGRFGRATIEVVNEPSPDNPATSQLAALSLLALLRDSALDSALQVGN